MRVLIDVGNTNIKIVKSDGNMIYDKTLISTNKTKLSAEYAMILSPLLNFEFDTVVIASVVPHVTEVLVDYFTRVFKIKPLILKAGLKTGIMINTNHPNQIGADLVAVAVGTLSYEEDEYIIVDAGTATKLIHVKDKILHGVVIAPGFKTSMDGLISNASLLADIPLDEPKHVLGKDTTACLQSGAIYGHASMIEGLIKRVKKEIGNPNARVIGTGGYLKKLIHHIDEEILYDDVLIMKGLNYIADKN